MTSTHDDYDAAARRYAAGLLRDEAERAHFDAVNAPDAVAADGMSWQGAALRFAADWLEAGA